MRSPARRWAEALDQLLQRAEHALNARYLILNVMGADVAVVAPVASSALAVKEYVCPLLKGNEMLVSCVAESRVRETRPSVVSDSVYVVPSPLQFRWTRLLSRRPLSRTPARPS